MFTLRINLFKFTLSQNEAHLKKTLGPFMLWGLGVGYVISGNYFGWNLGLEAGGTMGMLIALAFVIVMYVCFTFCYTEMACAIPKAGGAFDYVKLAMGKNWAFVAGLAQIIEFLFAPPAIALGLGAYINLFLPHIHPLIIAISAYLIFTGINILGIKTAASFELVVTVVAVLGLLLFAALALPHFSISNLEFGKVPKGFSGVSAAVPFAIWFFLAIEGVANVAEETINPQRNILIGFGSALFTLVVLCLLTFSSSVGIAGWEKVVFPAKSLQASDSPLPLALQTLQVSPYFITLIGIFGLFGLVASFNGIILAAGRATMEFAKAGNAPKSASAIHPKFKSPANALIFNMVIGIIALLTGKTGEIITIACFGALLLYMVSMLGYIQLNKHHSNLLRPFKAPISNISPYLAFSIAYACFICMLINYPIIGMIFFSLLAISFIIFKLIRK